MAKVSIWRNIYGSVATIFLLVNLVTCFELSGYCRHQCMKGQGGNLCKCNAVHFAGKRTAHVTDAVQVALADVFNTPEELVTNQSRDHITPREAQLLSEYRLNQLLRKFFKVRGMTGSDEADDENMAFLDGNGDSGSGFGYAPQNNEIMESGNNKQRSISLYQALRNRRN